MLAFGSISRWREPTRGSLIITSKIIVKMSHMPFYTSIQAMKWFGPLPTAVTFQRPLSGDNAKARFQMQMFSDTL